MNNNYRIEAVLVDVDEHIDWITREHPWDFERAIRGWWPEKVVGEHRRVELHIYLRPSTLVRRWPMVMDGQRLRVVVDGQRVSVSTAIRMVDG